MDKQKWPDVIYALVNSALLGSGYYQRAGHLKVLGRYQLIIAAVSRRSALEGIFFSVTKFPTDFFDLGGL